MANVNPIQHLVNGIRISPEKEKEKPVTAAVAGTLFAAISQRNGSDVALGELGQRIGTHLLISADGTPTPLGKLLGTEGSNIMLALAGPLPGLFINSLMTGSGFYLRKQQPELAYFLMGCGLTNHALSSIAPWQAAMMTPAQLQIAAAEGHHFANLILEIEKITGLSTHAIGASIAAGWTLFIPLVCLGVHIFQKTYETEMISDHAALQQWLLKVPKNPETKKQFNKLLKDYPRKTRWENALKKVMQLDEKLQALGKHFPAPEKRDKKIAESLNSSEFQEYRKEVLNLATYLMENVPQSALEKAKQDQIGSLKNKHYSSKLQKVINRVSLVSIFIFTAIKVGVYIKDFLLPGLAPIIQPLIYLTPLFAAMMLLSSIYETYNDLKSSDEVVPKKAKMISVAMLTCNVAYTVLATATAFNPVTGGLFFMISFFTLYAGLYAATYTKNHIVKKRITMLQALEPNNFSLMLHWLQNYQEEHENPEVNASNEKYVNLSRWIQKVRAADRNHLIKKEQRHQLVALGVLTPARKNSKE